jgi:hypothetical protein
MKTIFLVPAVFAALAFTIAESIHSMHRPDSIYVPLVMEVLVFAVSYVAFAIINATSIAPLSIALASRTSSRVAGLVFALAVAALGSSAVFALGAFGHKSSIVHRTYVFGAAVPLFLAALSAFHLAARRRAALARESADGGAQAGA